MQDRMLLTHDEAQIEHKLNDYIMQRLDDAATNARKIRGESSLYIYTFCVNLLADIAKNRERLLQGKEIKLERPQWR